MGEILRGICIALSLWCADSQTPPQTAVDVEIRWPAIASLPIVNPILAKPEISKPTGFPPDCPRQPPVEWQHLYVEGERRYPSVSACDVAKLTWCESRYDRLAVSDKGAKGLAQFLDSTAADLGVTDVFDVKQVIFAAFRYVEWTRSGWSVEGRTAVEIKGLGACSWNWGNGNCIEDQRRNGWYNLDEALPHWPQETQAFVPCILTGSRS